MPRLVGVTTGLRPFKTVGYSKPIATLLCQELRSDLVEKFDAFRNLGQRVFPVVLVLNGEDGLDALSFDLTEQGGNVRFACAPGYVVGATPVIVQIFEVEGNNSPFELFDGFQRVDI